MKICVASQNPVKIAAAREAFEKVFPESVCDVVALAAPSGVPDQPLGDNETLLGAQNRADYAQGEAQDCDFWVSLEGGIDVVGEQYFTFAWFVIQAADGRISRTRSMTLPLPGKVMQLVREGIELGYAFDQLYELKNSKHSDGAFGIITEGLHTRKSVYFDSLCCALMPFKNTVFQENI
ncbi:inosine/xanthosine triphosphatase [Polycladidibacter stylochi]|uniref:inosine/xanthosine triphosphatase n=1 Tax=Polycladidibacter stylochi TaxID=1807766 RepID=UPI00082A6B68|nr:inosine/xanthosine triphosphatase [Pseudovibrio stylochi]